MFLGNKRKAGDDIMNATIERIWQFSVKNKRRRGYEVALEARDRGIALRCDVAQYAGRTGAHSSSR